jgi:hypothetical protein
VLAVGSLAYGSSRLAVPAARSDPAPIGSTVATTASGAVSPRSAAFSQSSVRRAVHLRRESTTSISRHVHEAAARYGVPVSLVAAVISVESEFNPRAVSHRGALGLMQLMPTTAAVLGVRDAFDPRENVDAGARHLRQLLDRFGNDVPLALAAYNAGAHAVIRYGGVPPYPETRAFIARVLARAGQITLPTVAVAAVAPTPRIRVATPLTEPARGYDAAPVVIPAEMTDDANARPRVEPQPVRGGRWWQAAESGPAPVSVPTAFVRGPTPEAP